MQHKNTKGISIAKSGHLSEWMQHYGGKKQVGPGERNNKRYLEAGANRFTKAILYDFLSNPIFLSTN